MKALDVLERAISLIHGQRAKDYGDAKASFQRMADLVNPIIKKSDGKLTASDMALVMIQVKIARLQESPNHADSWIDIAGYAALGAQLAVTEPDKAATGPTLPNGISSIGANDIKPQWRDYSQDI
jgi:hypothetical protein